MTWIIIFGILLLILFWLLFSPLYLYISTTESRYEAGLKGVIRINLGLDSDGLPELKVVIFFIPFRFSFFKSTEKQKTKKKKKEKKKKKKKMGDVNLKTLWLFLKIGWKVYHSFKIKKLTLTIDTGNVIRNAYLIPVFSFYYNNRINLSVNYHQKNELIFHTESRLFTIIYNIITIFIKHKLKK